MEPLGKIFGSPARLKVLRLFLFNQDEAFPFAEIVRRTKLSSATVRREVNDLVSSGLIRKKGAHRTARYHVNQRFEHLTALNLFIRETTSVYPKKVVGSLKRAGTPRLIALSGIFTGAVESPVDLLVVGDTLDERTLQGAVRELEAQLGREIRYASFATPDFRYRLGIYDRLLRDVFDYPHRLLIDRIGV